MISEISANIFRLLPGGAVLCTSQFSKSIKVMKLLDQQMSTKKKMTEETEEKKTTNEGHK